MKTTQMNKELPGKSAPSGPQTPRWSLMKFTTWLLKVTRKLLEGFEIDNLNNMGVVQKFEMHEFLVKL